jgi:hypothetical protein
MSRMCSELHLLVHRLPLYSFPFDPKSVPANGIYVLFETDEYGHQGSRIVRIGTHTGHNQLPSRLTQHFLKENKDRSIFRKNIGRALLNRAEDPFLPQWELDLTTRQARINHAGSMDVDKQRSVENQVTSYIQKNFSFVVLGVDDSANRLELESKLISTVSLCEECGPSPHWLGLQSPKAKIRESGLWLVNELYKAPLTELDLGRLQALL